MGLPGLGASKHGWWPEDKRCPALVAPLPRPDLIPRWALSKVAQHSQGLSLGPLPSRAASLSHSFTTLWPASLPP